MEILLIPQAELSTGQAAAIRNGAVERVVSDTSRILRVPKEKLIVRDLRPKEDLDYTYASWAEISSATTAAYETMTSGTMGDQRFVGIYGVMDNSETIAASKLRIKVGNSIKTIWVLENLYSLSDGGPRIGFAPSVVIVPQNTPYTIQRYVTQGSLPANIVLKGFVVEPFGRVLSP